MAFLLEPDAYELLKANGISAINYGFAKCVEEATERAEAIGYPVALKIVSGDIVHKSDVGGVKTGIRNKEELKKAFHIVMDNAAMAVPNGDHKGVLITPMIDGGVETIIGIGNDSEFGKFILFGLGGIFAELYKDVSFRMIPLTKADALDLIDDVKASAILKGYRGEMAKNIPALAELLLQCSRMAEACPEIREMDLNPVIVREDGAYIVDVRIMAGK